MLKFFRNFSIVTTVLALASFLLSDYLPYGYKNSRPGSLFFYTPFYRNFLDPLIEFIMGFILFGFIYVILLYLGVKNYYTQISKNEMVQWRTYPFLKQTGISIAGYFLLFWLVVFTARNLEGAFFLPILFIALAVGGIVFSFILFLVLKSISKLKISRPQSIVGGE